MEGQGNVGRRPCRRYADVPEAARHRLVRFVDPPGVDELKPFPRPSRPPTLLIGPWVHGGQRSNVAGEVELDDSAKLDFDALRLRWYDHWLKGAANGVESDPPVFLYIMGTGDDLNPPAGRLAPRGLLASRARVAAAPGPCPPLLPDGQRHARDRPARPESGGTRHLHLDPKHPMPTIGGNISSNQNLMTNGGYDQRPRDDTHAAEDRLPLSERKDVLVFRTAPLPPT